MVCSSWRCKGWCMSTENKRRYEDQWHLDKRLNIGHILTTMTLVGAILSIWSDMDKRVTRLEVQQEQTQRVFEEVKQSLREINKKMDKLTERVLQSGGSR